MYHETFESVQSFYINTYSCACKSSYAEIDLF